MIGIVDVGGGNRDIYGAGVLDYCIDYHITFDYFIGVSAGSANGVSYISKQKKRNYRFYREYSMRKEYMSVSNFIKKGSLVDLDYIYSTLSNDDGEDPVDYQTFINNPIDLEVVATNALTGNPVYFRKDDIKYNNFNILKASSCVPVACKPYKINEQLYYDGGISDPIPFKRALSKGCNQVIIILTKPKHLLRDSKRDIKLSQFLKKKYPKAAQKLSERSIIYNKCLKEALELEKQGKVLILAPDIIEQLDTFSKDQKQLDFLYHKGYEDARKIEEFINESIT